MMRLVCVCACLWVLPALLNPALANVVMTGTRVIYPAALPGKTLQLSNQGSVPYLVQMWLDAGDEDSSPDQYDHQVPFVISPPIFRMEPGSGQAVRLMSVGTEGLPVDRESVFYLNFSQIPALGQDQQQANLLLLLLRNRIKLFYRPRGLLEPEPHKLACALRFYPDNDGLWVENPAAFHALVDSAELLLEGHRVPLLKGEMLAPFSRQHWPLPEALTLPVKDAQVRVSLVNDYGADTSHPPPLASAEI